MSISRRNLVVLGALVLAVVIGAMLATRFAAIRTSSAKVVLVEIDETTLSRFGRWPLSRGLQATAITRLRAAQPMVVVYGVIFDGYLPEDELLRQSVSTSGPPIVFPLNPTERPARSIGPLPQIPPVYFGLSLPQPNAAELSQLIIRGDSNATPHYIAVGACLVLKIARCSPDGRQITLTTPSNPFATIKYQDILDASSEQLSSQLAGKIVIVGTATAGLTFFRAKGTERFSEPLVLAQAMLTFLVKGGV